MTWSDVDAAPDPSRMVLGLDRAREEPYFQRRKARVRALLDSRPGEVIVDVGCGTADDGVGTIGIDNSSTMVHEARTRHPHLPVLVGDARSLALADASVDAVLADRVLQHLDGADSALTEWRRVLRPGGRLVTCDPDLTVATLEGVDYDAAREVLDWRAGTRPGRHVVARLRESLVAAGFGDVQVESHLLELSDLSRADGIFGLAGWSTDQWRVDVEAAAASGTLRYTCPYLIGFARRA